jgi:hypothetical protein
MDLGKQEYHIGGKNTFSAEMFTMIQFEPQIG